MEGKWRVKDGGGIILSLWGMERNNTPNPDICRILIKIVTGMSDDVRATASK